MGTIFLFTFLCAYGGGGAFFYLYVDACRREIFKICNKICSLCFLLLDFGPFGKIFWGLQVEGTGLECYGFTKESGSKDQIVLTRNHVSYACFCMQYRPKIE